MPDTRLPSLLVICGTDTAVGKTFVTTSLLRALRRRGASVRARKPVETGCHVAPHHRDDRHPSGLEPADARALRDAAGGDEPLGRVCLLACPRPVAPASELARLHPDTTLDDLARAARDNLRPGELAFVETAGGVLSPLAPDGATCADLAARLDADILLVAPDRLGTISQTAAAIEALQRRTQRTITVVLNPIPGARTDDVPLDNARWLAAAYPDVTVLDGPLDATIDALCDRLAPADRLRAPTAGA